MPDYKEKLPLITIGISCFNAAATIERALHSARSQDWPNFEVVVVDDGSSDGSCEILNQIARVDPRLRVVKLATNRGCAAARNVLVENARGDFIAFFDDDDVSGVDRLRLQHDHIVSYERKSGAHLVICYASGQRIYPNGYKMPIRAVGADGLPPVGHVMADYLLFNKQYPGVFYGAGTPTCSLMARTALFRDLGGFDIEMKRQEDIDFAIRIAFKGGHFVGIPESVIVQYATGGSEKSALAEFESFLRLLDKNADYLRANNSYSYMRIWSEMRYRHFANQDVRAVLVLARLMLAYPIRTAFHFAFSATRRFRHEQRINISPHG